MGCERRPVGLAQLDVVGQLPAARRAGPRIAASGPRERGRERVRVGRREAGSRVAFRSRSRESPTGAAICRSLTLPLTLAGLRWPASKDTSLPPEYPT